MKIIYVTAFDFPAGNAATKRVLNNIRALLKLGNDVEVLTIKKNYKKDKIELEEGSIKVSNLISGSLGNGLLSKIFIRLFAPLIMFKKLIERNDFDHVILYSGYSPFALSLLILKFFKSYKLIHDSVEWYTPIKKINFLSLKQLDIELSNRFLFFFFDGVICISSFLQNHFQKKKFFSRIKSTIKLPPLINESIFTTKEYWSNSRKIDLIYSGDIGPNKDRLEIFFETFHDLLQKNNKFRLTIIGKNEDKFRKLFFLNKLKEDFPESIICINKNLSLEDSMSYVKKSHFYVYFRDLNKVSLAGFPTKFVESISCSTPVITNLVGDIKDYHHHTNGLVCINDKGSISITLNKILNFTEEEYTQMSNEAFNSSKKFNYNYHIGNLKIFFNNIEK